MHSQEELYNMKPEEIVSLVQSLNIPQPDFQNLDNCVAQILEAERALEEIAPKKRGRKPKAAGSETASKAKASKKTSSEGDAAPAPKKRGRKSKAELAALAAAETPSLFPEEAESSEKPVEEMQPESDPNAAGQEMYPSENGYQQGEYAEGQPEYPQGDDYPQDYPADQYPEGGYPEEGYPEGQPDYYEGQGYPEGPYGMDPNDYVEGPEGYEEGAEDYPDDENGYYEEPQQPEDDGTQELIQKNKNFFQDMFGIGGHSSTHSKKKKKNNQQQKEKQRQQAEQEEAKAAAQAKEKSEI